MGWSLEVYLTAGLAALLLGGGVLWREPRRARNRQFALLCGAIALWTLGASGAMLSADPTFPWHRVYLLGSCAAAPLALHFTLVLARDRGPLRRRLLPAAYVAALALYVTTWFVPQPSVARLNRTALIVLGSILLISLAVLFRTYSRAPAGPLRNAHRLLFAGGLIAVAGGLSDFLSRDVLPVPELGPVAVLVFLVLVGSVIVRHRFMDVDVFLIRVVILLAAAGVAALPVFVVARLSGGRFVPIFVVTLLVVGIAGSLGRAVLSGARSLLLPQEPVARALLDVSRRLAEAVSTDEVWEAIRRGRAALPGDVHVDVVLADSERGEFAVRFRAGEGPPPGPQPRESALARMLGAQHLPLTWRFVEREAHEARGAKRREAQEALDALRASDARLAVPLLRGDELAGWIAVGGGFPDRYLTAEVAAAFLAVGNQAVASLERIEALERARRREALAAVGEMAAGLAHEVRNPVAAIRGAAQALAPAATPEQAREMIEVIEDETGRLGRVVGEFLEYARPGSPRREPVRLDDLARQALRAAELGGHGLRTELHVEPDAPAAAGDRDQLHRAFENLIRNAREAAGAEGVLRIDISRRPGSRVAVRFEDNGPGIADDALGALFRPFYTTRAGGTGLGLALVHRIVEAHGGRIDVDGRPGRGAVFTLVLPAAAPIAGAGPPARG